MRGDDFCVDGAADQWRQGGKLWIVTGRRITNVGYLTNSQATPYSLEIGAGPPSHPARTGFLLSPAVSHFDLCEGSLLHDLRTGDGPPFH